MAGSRHEEPQKSTRTRKPPKRVDWRPAFITALGRAGIVLAAAQAAGVDRTTAYRERERNPEFAAQWDEAIDESADRLEAEARRRATTVGSDRLLMAMLKAYRPERYGDRQRVEVSGGVRLESEYLRIRSAITDALHAYPEARRAVAERLAALDEQQPPH